MSPTYARCAPIWRAHRLRVHRVSHVDPRLSYAELSATFEANGAATTCPECILFEQDTEGLICRVSVFFKQRRPAAT